MYSLRRKLPLYVRDDFFSNFLLGCIKNALWTIMPPKKCTPKLKKKVAKVDSKENLTTSELKLRYRSLKKRCAELDKEIAQLKALGVTEDLKPEMQALHEYNDIKDVTQMVLGYLADTENCTVGQLHKKYDLPLD